MDKYITKLKIINFGRFKDLTLNFNQEMNILIGDNEAGKSTILNAIDLVLSGNANKVESLGLDNIFNKEVINNFLRSTKDYEKLPILSIELYLNDSQNQDLEGKFNSCNELHHGLLMICEPRDDLSKIIKSVLGENNNFPFEFYSIKFKTFSGESYTGYKKFMQSILLDSSQIRNEYATKSYIKNMFHSTIDNEEVVKLRNEYRNHKDNFKINNLSKINLAIDDYDFAIKSNSKSNLDNDLTIQEDEVDIENKGKGRQCFIKTDFALKNNKKKLDVILLEEPENHLSHTNIKKLLTKIQDTKNKQVFITTHSNFICSRLDLRKAILLNSNTEVSIKLTDLKNDTSKYFMKAPDNNILEFIMSKKVLLVEGDSEYILMQQFFENESRSKPEDKDVHIISVGGTSFKRYLEIALLLNIKTAIVKDNDGNYIKNCKDYANEFARDFIKVFGEPNNTLYTFEKCMYRDNLDICKDLFEAKRRSLGVEEFMLANKADCAFELLDKKGSALSIPNYIKEAIEWINN